MVSLAARRETGTPRSVAEALPSAVDVANEAARAAELEPFFFDK
jgi:hypothetical protein